MKINIPGQLLVAEPDSVSMIYEKMLRRAGSDPYIHGIVILVQCGAEIFF